jgi:hypothetical protein
MEWVMVWRVVSLPATTRSSQRGGTRTYVTDRTRVTAAELRAGLRLGLDGRDVIREDWDGRITVRFAVADGERTSTRLTPPLRAQPSAQ